MSSLLAFSSLPVESPITNSQLYFHWFEDLQDDPADSETEGVPATHETKCNAADAAPPTVTARASGAKRKNPICGGIPNSNVDSSPNGPKKTDLSGQTVVSDDVGIPHDRLEIHVEDGVPRIAKPVLMGGVMIQLLKRYGITDQEIKDGIARYALGNRAQAAS